MNQIALFDDDDDDPAAQAKRARDEALDLVNGNAGHKWQAAALRVVREMPAVEMTGEDIRLACHAQGVRPHHHNAWGAFIMVLVRAGVLEWTGREQAMKTKRSHGRRTRVYRKAK